MATFYLSHIIIAAIAFALGAVIFNRSKDNPADSGVLTKDFVVDALREASTREPQNNRSAAARMRKAGAASETKQSSSFVGFRIFHILFLSGWLVAWSAAIVMVSVWLLTSLAAPGFHSLFLGGWLIAAGAGWFLALKTLFALFRGEKMDHPFQLIRRK